MKKHLLLVIVLMFSLVACATLAEEEIDEELPQVYTYQLTNTNFESFYELDFEFYDLGGVSYKIVLDIKPKFDFDISYMHVRLKFQVIELYGETEFIEEYVVSYQMNEDFSEEIIRDESPFLDFAYLRQFDLEIAPNTIKVESEVELSSQTYPMLFDMPNLSIVDIGDPVLNQTNYENFLVLVNQLEAQDGNHAMIRTTETLIVSSEDDNMINIESSTIQIQKEPMYVFYSDDEIYHVTHKLSGTNDFVDFVFNDSAVDPSNKYWIQPVKITQADAMLILNDLGINDNSTPELAYNYNPSFMRFDAIPNGFKVQSALKDMVPKDVYNELVNLYSSMGLDAEILKTTIVEIRLTYIQNVYVLSVDMVFNFKDPVEQMIQSKFEYVYNFNEFMPRYVDDQDFLILAPLSAVEVIFETNPFSPVYAPFTPYGNYYKVYLEPGTYDMFRSNLSITIQINDVHDELADISVISHDSSMTDIYQTFTITEEGIYYFIVDSMYDLGAHTFHIIKTD